MRVDVVTSGSHGDLRPYLALCRGLAARGHEARVVAPNCLARTVESAGVVFVPAGPSGDEAEIRAVFTALAAEPDPNEHAAVFLRMTHESSLARSGAVIEATSAADLIIGHSVGLLGFVAAEINRKPYVTAHLSPCLIMTPLLMQVGGEQVSRTTDPWCNKFLVAHGLSPRQDVLLRGGHSPTLNLVAVSPAVVAPNPAWSGNYPLTGYWTDDKLSAELEGEPTAELRAFVEGGPPPVVVSLGSLFGYDSRRITEVVVDAIATLGARAVIQAGWMGLGDVPLPPGIVGAGVVSHDWLFRHAACVIHHGGAGTTAAALRAGKPMVITHGVADQLFWSLQTLRLGVNAAPLALENLTVDELAARVRVALEDKDMRARAAELGLHLRAESGVENAVRLLEGQGASARS
jgi:sterol 3beta-glucosyltransferase